MSFTKQYFILITFSLFSIGTFAQTTYQSQHVKNGKTLQFSLPKGFYEVIEMDEEIGRVYTNAENADVQNLREVQEKIPSIVFTQLPVKDHSLASLFEQLEEGLKKNGENVVEIKEPEIVEINGRDVILAGFKGKIDGQEADAAYVGAIRFGDYFMLVTYYARSGTKGIITYKRFEKVISSWEEVETDRENTSPPPENDVLLRALPREEVVYEDDFSVEGSGSYAVPPPPPPAPSSRPVEVIENKVYYVNSSFETKFEHSDILPNLDENWKTLVYGKAQLLSEIAYNKNRGSIKVFSGGSTDNYAGTGQLGLAVQLAVGIRGRLVITKGTQLQGEHHTFEMYTIAGKERTPSFYTTVVSGELVFFVVDTGSEPDTDFISAAQDFMQKMHVRGAEE